MAEQTSRIFHWRSQQSPVVLPVRLTSDCQLRVAITVLRRLSESPMKMRPRFGSPTTTHLLQQWAPRALSLCAATSAVSIGQPRQTPAIATSCGGIGKPIFRTFSVRTNQQTS